MPAANSQTTAVQIEGFYSTSFTLTDSTSLGQLTDTTTGLFRDANEIPHLTDFGDLGISGNEITYSEYGNDTEQSVAGVATANNLDLTLAYDASNTVHQALHDLAINTAMTVGIKIQTAATEITYIVVRARFGGASLQTGTGEVSSLLVNVYTSGRPVRFDAA